MKRITVFLALLGIVLSAHGANPKIDSIKVIAKTDTTITAVGYSSSNSSVNLVTPISIVGSTVQAYPSVPHMTTGSFADTVVFGSFLPVTAIQIEFKITDGIATDTLVIIDTTLSGPPDSAQVGLLTHVNVGQFSGQLLLNCIPNGYPETVQFRTTTNLSLPISNWTIDTVIGGIINTSVVTITRFQSPGTTTYWVALGANQLNYISPDTSNIDSLVTLPLYAGPPHIIDDSTYFNNFSYQGAMVNFLAMLDSIGGLDQVISSPDSLFTTQTILWVNGVPAGLSSTGVWVPGYGPSTPAWVKLIVSNSLGSDTQIVHFSTLAEPVYPPQVTAPLVFQDLPDSAKFYTIPNLSGAPSGFIWFEVAYANDTSNIFVSSTPTNIDSSATFFSDWVHYPQRPLSLSAMVVRAAIFNSDSLVYSAFVPYTIPNWIGISEIDGGIKFTIFGKAPENCSVEVYDLLGRVVFKNEINVQEFYISKEQLPKGILLYQISGLNQRPIVGKFIVE